MYSVLLLSLVCFAPSLAAAKSPKEATRAMLRLMPNDKGFLFKLKELVAAGADLKATDKQGMNILHRIALWQGDGNSARYVVDHQIDLTAGEEHGTPMLLAVYSDNVAVVDALMKYYDLSTVDKHGMGALLYALKYKSHRVAKSLIGKEAVDITAKTNTGRGALHMASDPSVVRLLLAQGADPNEPTDAGMTPLNIAVSYDHISVIRELLKGGANPNAKGGKSGLSPLHFTKSPEAAKILLAHGANANVRSDDGITPAHLISDANTLKILATHGAKLNVKDKQGATPLDYARINQKSISLIKALETYGAVNTAAALEQLKERDDRDDDHDEEGHEQVEQKQPDYLINMTEVAGKESSNPVIGRELEVEQLLNTLKRKFMRGAVLVGDSGVGKTALIEGIAYLLANDELPEFAGSEIYALDVGGMWGHAESKWVGQLHKRVNEALKFIAAKPDKRILFIDEIHQLLGGARFSSRGSPPITDTLKPYLGRGDIKLIGSTTHDEYQSIIEEDRAIVDRLLRVDISEPSVAETLAILRGIKASYEQHYGIVITEPALQAAVNLSNRYMTDQQQPRKAINLLDETAASLSANGKRLTKKHVATAVAKKIGIPVATITKSKNEKAVELLSELQQHIFGQDQALEEISSSLTIASADLADETRPQASLLFVGTTGVGKTLTAKVIAQKLLDSEKSLVSVDMSGFKLPSSVGDLTELLTRAVKEKRYAVILLDEIEKAHKEVRGLLLQLLDEGRLTDKRQRKVDFTNTIIIATTNSPSVESEFAPELLNRFDRVVKYKKLDTQVSLRLVQDQLDALNDSLKDRKISIVVSEGAMNLIASIGYDKKYGAREMARVFSQLVKHPLAEAINRGVVSRGVGSKGKEYRLDLQRKGSSKIHAKITTDAETVLETMIPHSQRTKNKGSGVYL